MHVMSWESTILMQTSNDRLDPLPELDTGMFLLHLHLFGIHVNCYEQNLEKKPIIKAGGNGDDSTKPHQGKTGCTLCCMGPFNGSVSTFWTWFVVYWVGVDQGWLPMVTNQKWFPQEQLHGCQLPLLQCKVFDGGLVLKGWLRDMSITNDLFPFFHVWWYGLTYLPAFLDSPTGEAG